MDKSFRCIELECKCGAETFEIFMTENCVSQYKYREYCMLCFVANMLQKSAVMICAFLSTLLEVVSSLWTSHLGFPFLSPQKYSILKVIGNQLLPSAYRPKH